MTPAGWRLREPPLDAVAVLARDAAVRPLAEATLARVTGGATLRVAASPGRLVVLGEANDLPWADGVTYLGDDDGLLVPTTLAPTVPADVLRAAVARNVPPAHTLLVVAGDDVLTGPRPARAADEASVLRVLA